MDIIGIIAEFNPFHNGHKYFIDKIKENNPDSIIILVLNGYFLERGEISIESKSEKTNLALKYGCDIVIELPFVFGSQSADIFADTSITLLNELGVKKIIFGSESNDIKILEKVACAQLEDSFDKKVKQYLDEGINYPTALSKAIGIKVDTPNDLLGISYIKSIIKNKYNIKYETIKRTNDYHDISSNDDIISATNIRNKLSLDEDISKYIPEGNINRIDYDLFFNLIKSKILTDTSLDKYISVDEGLDNRLKKLINEVASIDELIEKVKSKRYTKNRISRMLIHILIGLTKEDMLNLKIEYIRLLGFTTKGMNYLNTIKKDVNIPIITKFRDLNSKIKEYEIKAANIYKMLTGEDTLIFENNNKPIIKE